MEKLLLLKMQYDSVLLLVIIIHSITYWHGVLSAKWFKVSGSPKSGPESMYITESLKYKKYISIKLYKLFL